MFEILTSLTNDIFSFEQLGSVYVVFCDLVKDKTHLETVTEYIPINIMKPFFFQYCYSFSLCNKMLKH